MEFIEVLPRILEDSNIDFNDVINIELLLCDSIRVVIAVAATLGSL